MSSNDSSKNTGGAKIVPLGVLLSEEKPKFRIEAMTPTSATWTGGPDSQVADPDA